MSVIMFLLKMRLLKEARSEHALESSNESSVNSSWDKQTQDVIMVQEIPLLITNPQGSPSTLHPEEEEEKQSNPNEVTSMDDEIDSHHMKVDLFLRKLLANADHNAACERNKADKPFKAVSAIKRIQKSHHRHYLPKKKKDSQT